jgi:hypothetical protein
MSHYPPIRSFRHPFTHEIVKYNCVLGIDGRSTLCLIHDQGVHWGEVWLDELPEPMAHELLARSVEPAPSEVKPLPFWTTLFTWIAGVIVLIFALLLL